MNNSKVSIITPLYNSENFIGETIDSVIAQTYIDWEMLIVDDCSTDNSRQVVEQYIKTDSRIRYFRTKSPSGSPSDPRNIGIKTATGRYVAFLDSDDLWVPNKLELQVPLFSDDKVAVVFSNYVKINEDGEFNGGVITAPTEVTYSSLLKGNVIACLTSVYDRKKTGKLYFTKQGHEDFALWLEILKKGYLARNSNLVMAKYRVRKSSVSSNKLKVIKWYYIIYRENEKLSLIRTFYYLTLALNKSFFKYIK